MKLLRTLSVALVSCAFAASAGAQAKATASGPGAFISFGGGFSGFQSDYGQRTLGGGFAYVDMHPTWRYGLEAEARFLNKHTDQGVTETNYLIGPHVYLRSHRFRPYVKFLVGAGEFQFPFNYAHGEYFVLAPGGGVDLVLSDRLTLRPLDVEFQSWPQFTYGNLHPYGISAGISYRINAPRIFPRH